MLASGLLSTTASAEKLWTPAQVEGPFFPESTNGESDADMTRLVGSTRRAKGQEVVIHGTVRDLRGRPLAGAEVEVWQACASGRYHHSSDSTKESLDPDFQYYCFLRTDKQGRYRFHTVRPGSYSVSSAWERPPHIHFKVRSDDHPELITQMYFAGNVLNRKDSILQAIPRRQQKLVVVNFQALKTIPVGRFDIILNSSDRQAHLATPVLL